MYDVWVTYDTWSSGSGEKFEISEILNQVKVHINANGKVFIGTDSFLTNEKCTFATTIVLHGADCQIGGKYYFMRTKRSSNRFNDLLVRMLKETQDSIDVALMIAETFPGIDLEVHLDIGSSIKSKTRKFVKMLTSYTRSAGFKCKIKPHAWASASIADKHSKHYI
jgi:predicted RNase H-related nuclease YkuK (DUF458 family)